MITMYSKPNCPHCDGAQRWLTENEFAFVKVDVTKDAAALAKIKADGHQTVPQIYLGDEVLVPGGFAGLRKVGAGALRARLAGTDPE